MLQVVLDLLGIGMTESLFHGDLAGTSLHAYVDCHGFLVMFSLVGPSNCLKPVPWLSALNGLLTVIMGLTSRRILLLLEAPKRIEAHVSGIL